MEEYLTEHWLYNGQKDELDLFIEECRSKLNEELDAQRRRNCGLPPEGNE